MERIRALSTGTKLTFASGLLLFASLFFTWQKLEVDYSGVKAIALLDGWDVFGLLIALVSLSVLVLVALRQFSEIEFSEDLPWDVLTLALGGLAFLLTFLKNVTDRDSTWESYAAVAVSAVLAFGTFALWAEAQRDRRHQLRRLTSRTRSSPGPS